MEAFEKSEPPVRYILGVRMLRQKEVNTSVLGSRARWLDLDPSDQLHSEIKEGYSVADCKSHPPAKIRPHAATRCSVERSARGRLGALLRVHLKIIRLSRPPVLK